MPELVPSPPRRLHPSDEDLPVAEEIADAESASRDGVAENASTERRPDTLQHAIYLALAIGVVLASLTLGVGESKKVVLPYLGVPLPSICQFKNFTGIDCPGCGLSRAFIYLAHGDVAGAWRYNPAAGLVFMFVVAQIPLRSVQLWRISRGQAELNWRRAGNWAIAVLAVALISQWLVKLAWWVIGW